MHIVSVFGIQDREEFEQKSKEILFTCFSKVRLYEVNIPEKMTTGDLSVSILSFIDTPGK